MNISNWTEYLKRDGHDGLDRNQTNSVYAPMVSPDLDVLCMDFSNARITLPNDFYFQRELYYLEKFKGYNWAPEVLTIDKTNKRIFFKWYGETCNDLVYTNRSVDNQQLKSCIRDILAAGVYKLNVYPHCFYFDKNDKIHTMGFYACVEKSDPYIPLEQVESLIGKESIHRWQEAIEGDKVNFKLFFNRAILEYVKWPGDPLKELSDV